MKIPPNQALFMVWHCVRSYVSKCGSVGVACLFLTQYVQFEEKLILSETKWGFIFCEALNVISGVLKVMTLKTHGDFCKRISMDCSRVIWQIKGN